MPELRNKKDQAKQPLRAILPGYHLSFSIIKPLSPAHHLQSSNLCPQPPSSIIKPLFSLLHSQICIPDV
jgi:hypothetical protein